MYIRVYSILLYNISLENKCGKHCQFFICGHTSYITYNLVIIFFVFYKFTIGHYNWKVLHRIQCRAFQYLYGQNCNIHILGYVNIELHCNFPRPNRRFLIIVLKFTQLLITTNFSKILIQTSMHSNVEGNLYENLNLTRTTVQFLDKIVFNDNFLSWILSL